jgi:hypothetical protein
MSRTDLPTDHDGDPAATCEYCGRPFTHEQYLVLHRGVAHDGEITDEEREAYERASEREDEALRRFRLKALAALVALYFGFLMLYAVVTG